jgi:predicted porin
VVCGDALAAVAVSGAAFAQVTISGVFDVNAVKQDKTTTTAASGNTNTSVKTNNLSDNNGWSTSELRIGGSEDLGGGLTASFQLNTGLNNGASSLADRDRWLQLSGGFGAVRIGAMGNVAGSDGFHGYTQIGNTSTGTTYFLGTAGDIARQRNVINYTTPNFNGVTAQIGTARTSSDSSDAAKAGKNSTTQNSLSVAYSAGPLSAGFGTTNRTINTETASAVTHGDGVAGSAAVTASETKVKANWVGASYNLGVATLGLAVVNNDSKKDGVASRDQKFTAYGVTVPMGAITLRASAYSGKDSATAAATDNIKLSGHQVSVTYALSKRTFVYAYMGEGKTKRDGAASTVAVAKTTSTRVGLSHSF